MPNQIVCPKCYNHGMAKSGLADGKQRYLCKVCNAAKTKEYYQANTEKETARQKAWSKDNPEKHAARNRKWRKANPEKHGANVKAWKEANLGKVTEYAVKHMAAKLERTVAWADRNKISEFYTSAHPNAGLPNAFGEYDQTAEEMSLLIKEYLESKCVNIIGGCCGTTPKHIKLIAEQVKNFSPRNLN